MKFTLPYVIQGLEKSISIPYYYDKVLIKGENVMKISAKGRYAIRAMINIALNESKEPKTLLEISKHQGISLSYLEQLFALLRKGNLVSGVRGPGGGYRLSSDPNNITIAQIINAINSDQKLQESQEQRDIQIWEKFSDKLRNYLETVTLGSLIHESESSIVHEPVSNDSTITEESIVDNEKWDAA